MMDEIILRGLQGRLTPDEQVRLLRWRRADPRNERRYRAAADVWRLTGEAAVDPTRWEWPPFEAVMHLARREPAEEATSPPGGQRSGAPGGSAARPERRLRPLAAALATGLLAASLGGIALSTSDDAPVDGVARSFEGEFVTGVGELATVTLADGTSIRLSESSRLRLTKDGTEEIAELEGRAFFGVRSDSSRTFRVRTRSGEAIVHGTRFEVRSEQDEFRVVVVEGTVEMVAAGSSVELGAGGMGHAAQGAPLAASEVEDVYAHLDWMGNSLVFLDTPLSLVLAELERRLDLPAVLVDEELADFGITATFTDQPAADVLHVICATIRAECVVEAGAASIANRQDREGPANE